MYKEKIILTPIKRIRVKGGDIIHNIKKTDHGFEGFGETYYSFINHGEIKGWKKHLKMTMNITCPVGKVKFIFSENLIEFKEILLDKENLYRITVKPDIWFSFQGLHNPFSLINNVSNLIHDDKEVERKELNSVNYKWENPN